MTSLFSSLSSVKKYKIEHSFVPLVVSSESFIIIYEEHPRPLIRLFNRKIEFINDYKLLKENRSMSSICSTNDRRLFILYRFDDLFVLGLLIVEWNGIWRVDIFSSSLHKLHTGFRFNGWTRDTWLSEWSPHKCWFVGSTHHLMINSKGQPINIEKNRFDFDINNITWMINKNNHQIKMIVTRGEKFLTFVK
ncbi:unnamed protein product [Rotaria socialis]|uniref:Uncharacterized protein n=1 Tax=Rotaria socialis TaxID=392032 RepID=A0A820XCY5_9BILA|nr:unnamed protein product [Rotaria socialis]CAF3427874.1 unnamed protein product [Rotaria socialis]CAF4528114.1 unnamed protein product [Rotaria socialis]CAF4552035.1 unnamed protein product [Rotaria socialis]